MLDHADAPTRARARAAYLDAIAPWQQGEAYRIPTEFVVVAAQCNADKRGFEK